MRPSTAADSAPDIAGAGCHDASLASGTADTDRHPSTRSADARVNAAASFGTGTRSGTSTAGSSVNSSRCSGAHGVFFVLGAHQAVTCDCARVSAT